MHRKVATTKTNKQKKDIMIAAKRDFTSVNKVKNRGEING